MLSWTGKYSKDRYYGVSQGWTTFDVKCFCGKLCQTRDAYEKHMKTKHPKRVRTMKKSGQWQQDKLEHWVHERKAAGSS